MEPNNPNKSKVVIAITAAILVLIIVVLLALPGENETSVELKPDPATATKLGKPAVSYPGLVDLSERGFTSYQMQVIKYGFYQFANQATTFAINPATIVAGPYDPSVTPRKIQYFFEVKIDGKTTYDVVAEKHVDYVTARLYIFQKDSKKLLYDSQLVDGRGLGGDPAVQGD